MADGIKKMLTNRIIIDTHCSIRKKKRLIHWTSAAATVIKRQRSHANRVVKREREHIEKDEKKEKEQETGFSSGTTTRTTWEAVGHGTRCAGRVPRRRRSRPQQQRRRRDHSVEKGRFSCIHFPPVPPLNLRLSTHLPVPTRSHDTL